MLLKNHICFAPILAYPQFDRPLTLQTDASDVGLGAVLTQFDLSGHEHVISYASRSLSDREKRYSATEKEHWLSCLLLIIFVHIFLLENSLLLLNIILFGGCTQLILKVG